ncbi:MAG TPA: pyruvate carboxylase, partial [Syntrophaceae bacterium]|nr:pyruvate carboxylase [Syntrophaceae bacterium]
ALTGFYGPPPLLTVVNTLDDYGHEAIGLDRQAVIDTSNKLRHERPYYRDFESQFFGFDPTVQTHKLPGGATGSSFEQAQKGGFLDRMPEILQNELPRVQVELGNFWSVTPGSQILWTTAANNIVKGVRYKDASDDLKNLLLERYGKFPFYKPAPEIYEAVFGKDWKKIVRNEAGYQKIEDVDLDIEKRLLEHAIGRKATADELVLYLQHPHDAADFFKFEEKFGKTWVLPPKVWLKRGGFSIGDRFEFPDAYGKHHSIEIGPLRRTKDGSFMTILGVDYHPEPILTVVEDEARDKVKPKTITAKEIEALALAGDIRATLKGVVNSIPVAVGETVSEGDTLVVLEAMKMLTNITAEISGEISEILVSPGSSVDIGDKLIMMEI